MKQKRSLLEAAVYGIGIGVPITLLCMTLIGGFNSIVKEFLVWTIASAIFGILSVLIFSDEREWSVPKAMILHCISCLFVAVVAGAICGYTNDPLNLCLSIVPVFFVAYILAYLISYLLRKAEEKRINQSLKK